MSTITKFKENDVGLMNVKMAASACHSTAKILAKYGKITPKLPITVPHILCYGPAGTGKTTRIEAAADLMGCTEEEGTFIRINPDCVKSIEELTQVLSQRLSWEGYLCNHGKINHCDCPKHNHCIVDVENPRGPIKQQIVFLDEIHVLPKEIQEKLGLVILDFRYQLKQGNNLKTLYFPKFTFCGATTRPGELIKPLRTRFGIKIAVTHCSEQEMLEISDTMVRSRGWTLEDGTKSIISKISQGVPRELDNHLTGLFNCWMYMLNTGQCTSRCVITKEVALNYIRIQKFLEDGTSYAQLKVLQYLASNTIDGKARGMGVTRLCNAIGIDEQRYYDEVEPRLVTLGYVVAGGRGREVTENGINYLSDVLDRNPNIVI